MPEARLGYFCDVGVSFRLGRISGGLGIYLALTGEFLNGVDCVKAGVADYYVKSENLKELENALKTEIK